MKIEKDGHVLEATNPVVVEQLLKYGGVEVKKNVSRETKKDK